MARIDAHQHFWSFNEAEYGWIEPSMTPLRRDFGPADLQPLCEAAGVQRVVAVQARQSLAETHALVELAERHALIGAVVGWVPLIDPSLASILDSLATHRVLTGVRHVLHDESDDDYCLRDDFNRGMALLPGYQLAYDLLIFPRHLPQAIRLVDRHPQTVFVVDHLAKPRIEHGGAGRFDTAWAQGIRELAKRAHVHCKVSGLCTQIVSEAALGVEAQVALLRPYVETALEAFGPGRLMFGSDWPVCLLRTAYGDWVRTVEALLASLSADEQAALWAGNARKIYRVKS